MGLLRVKGTINVDQFWPDGESDADTTKVVVDVNHNAFAFQQKSTSQFKTTHVFNDATVIGKVRKKVIDKKNRITVRLQGIDAPELHYSAAPLAKSESTHLSEEQRSHLKELNKKYRQHLGETAAINLRDRLKRNNIDNIPCSITTQVHKPNDVFDTYGRLVGDIIVDVPGSSINIGPWLVQEGWAFPTFYNSMSDNEIQLLINATKKGKTKKRIWKHLQTKLGSFDFTLVYEKEPSSVTDTDAGPLIMPKLFRRQCTWAVRRKATVTTKDFVNFIKSGKDQFFLLTEFLEQGESASPLHRIEEFIKNNTFGKGPEELVFREDPSKLVDAGGQIITDW